MAFSYVAYVASTGDKTYTLPFVFLQASHVKAKIDGVAETDFTVSTDLTEITFGGSVTILGGEYIYLYRETPRTLAGQLVDFTSSAGLTEEDMDTARNQLLYALQETLDLAEAAVSKDLTEDSILEYDAQGLRIKDLGAPTIPGDAARLLDVQNAQTSSGSLPTVGTGQNDYGLFVNSGSWASRSPANALAHLGLTNVPERLTALEAGGLAAVVTYTPGALEVNTQADWFEYEPTIVIPSAIALTTSGDTDASINTGADGITLKAGKWALIVTGVVEYTSTGALDTTLDWAVTNEVNGSSGVQHLIASQLTLQSQYDRHQIHGVAILDQAGATDVCLRAAAGLAKLELKAPAQMLVFKLPN